MKKVFALLLAATMLVSVVACAAKNADTAPAPASQAAAEPAKEEAAAQAEPSAEPVTEEHEPVTIEYWLPCNDLDEDPAECKGVISVARAFQEKYPWITIEMVPISGNSDESNAKVQMAAAANNMPDLLSFSLGYVNQWANTGIIMELSDIASEIQGNYATGALDDVNSRVDGYWAVPYTSECQGWAYNTEILAKYGLEVPHTFDDFLNVCNVLLENGEVPVAHGATDIWAIWGYHALFCQYGVTPELCESIQNGETDIYTCEPYRKTLARIQEIANTGAYGDAVSYTSNDEAEAKFLNGEAAVYNFATSFVSELEESPYADNFVFDYGPQFPDSEHDETVGMRVFGWCNYVGSKVADDPAKLEAIKLWLNYLTGAEGTQLLWEAGTIPGTDLSVVDTSSMDSLMKSVFESLNDGSVYSVSDQCVSWYDASFKAPYRNAVTAIITGAADIDGAMQMMKDWQTSFVGN